MLHPARVNLPTLLLRYADLPPPRRRETVLLSNRTNLGAMAPWVVTPSELKTAAAHYPEMSLSEAISVKTPILYSQCCAQPQHSTLLKSS